MQTQNPNQLLKPISNLSFDEPSHTYFFNGAKIGVSVTGVVSHDLSEFARQKIAETKPEWEPRGNCCHQALEAHLTGQTVEMGDYAEWVAPLLEFPLWDRYGAIGVEYRLVDRQARYAGSCDFLLKGRDRDDRPAVILGDLKSKSANGKCGDHRAQLGAYARMLQQWHSTLEITRCIVVNSFPGRVELSVHTLKECIDAWDQRWKDYCDWEPEF